MSRSDKIESYYLQSLERLRTIRKNSSFTSTHVNTRASEPASSFIEDNTHPTKSDHEVSSLAQPTDEEFVSTLEGITEHLTIIEKRKATIVGLLESQVEEGLPLTYESQKKMLTYVETCTELLQNLPQYQAALNFGSDTDWEHLHNYTNPSLNSEHGSHLQSVLHLLKNHVRTLERISTQFDLNDWNGKLN